ncbi:MAG: hypothetical protein ACRDTJ_30235, partial [Pseudonocardiaceae bacterium]
IRTRAATPRHRARRGGAVVAVTDRLADRPTFPMLDGSSGLSIDYDELALLVEVHRLVDKAVALAGESVPPVGSSQWWDAEPMVRLAALLLLAEHHLLADPERIAAEQLKAVSVAISGAKDWSAAAHRLVFDSHAKVAERRREPGPLAGLTFDPVAAARWVETGSSEEPAA